MAESQHTPVQRSELFFYLSNVFLWMFLVHTSGSSDSQTRLAAVLRDFLTVFLVVLQLVFLFYAFRLNKNRGARPSGAA